MTAIIWQTICLGIAALINYALGLTDSLCIKKFDFDLRDFLAGAIKAVIIGGSLIGIGFIWTYSGIDISGAGYTPTAILSAGICYYCYKVIKRLVGMWGEKPIDEVDNEVVFDINPIDTGIMEDASEEEAEGDGR